MGFAMQLRQVELVSADSDKFWTVWTKGSVVLVRYGRTGTHGTTKAMKHDSVEAAITAAERLVAKKLRKGYCEPTPAPLRAAADPGRRRKKRQGELGRLWEKLESIAQEHGRSLRLRDGASEKTVAAAEKKLGRAIPSDYRESMLLHDGQHEDAEAFAFLPGCGLLSPVDAIVDFHGDLVELAREYPAAPHDFDDEGITHLAVFHADRVPLAGYPFWDGDNAYIDFAQGPKAHPAS